MLFFSSWPRSVRFGPNPCVLAHALEIGSGWGGDDIGSLIWAVEVVTCGQRVVSLWSVCGQSVVSPWSIRGQSVVSLWSGRGQPVVRPCSGRGTV